MIAMLRGYICNENRSRYIQFIHPIAAGCRRPPVLDNKILNLRILRTFRGMRSGEHALHTVFLPRGTFYNVTTTVTRKEKHAGNPKASWVTLKPLV